MLKKNKLNLWDLYNKNIYIQIRKQIAKFFFDNFTEYISKLKIRDVWHYKTRSMIPLDLVIKILKLLPSKEKMRFERLIESNIKCLRFGYGKSKAIKNPKLPIIFSPNLARICGHLIGDGGIRLYKGDYAVHYTNKDSFLIEQFKEDVLNIFGNIEPYHYEYKIKDKNIGLKKIRFPSIIGVILMKFFGPMIKNKKKVPVMILKSDKKSKSLFLQALFDDEGCVSSNRVLIEMSNKDVIESIKKMLESDFFIIPSSMSEKNHGMWQNSYRLEIHGKKDMVLFSKKIGFSHPKKKEKLNMYIKKYKNKKIKSKRGELKNRIIDMFKKGCNLSVYQIAEKLNIQPKRSFRKHLYSLERNNILKVRRDNKYKVKIYSLKDENT